MDGQYGRTYQDGTYHEGVRNDGTRYGVQDGLVNEQQMANADGEYREPLTYKSEVEIRTAKGTHENRYDYP